METYKVIKMNKNTINYKILTEYRWACVHCKTIEAAKDFIETIQPEYSFYNTPDDYNWYRYREQTCYDIFETGRKIEYCDKDYYVNEERVLVVVEWEVVEDENVQQVETQQDYSFHEALDIIYNSNHDTHFMKSADNETLIGFAEDNLLSYGTINASGEVIFLGDFKVSCLDMSERWSIVDISEGKEKAQIVDRLSGISLMLQTLSPSEKVDECLDLINKAKTILSE